MENLTENELNALNLLLNKVQTVINTNDSDYLYEHKITKIIDKCFSISKSFKNVSTLNEES